jgi:hypothetical protein
MGTRQLTVIGVAGLVLAGLLAGCSNGGSGSSSTSSAGASMSATPPSASSPASPSPGGANPSPTPSGLPSGLGLPSPSGKSTPAAGQQTLTGQVEAGVERGCLVLRDEGGSGTYQLMGGDAKIVYAGARVSVTGHIATGIMSYCMQGRPFQVTDAHKLP